jgi:eukaryotic-like serine/threonine-protein kinase
LSGGQEQEFYKEADRLEQLDHPNIVRVYEFGLEGSTPYLAMSYATHGTLKERYPANVAVPDARIVYYVKQIAEALHYVHTRNLVHRDIKPENILLGPNDQVMLGDFGIAMDTQQQARQEALGTIEYMAPEQIRKQACAASDQYSLAVIVYEWLCGTYPFTGPTKYIAVQHLQDSPPLLSTYVSTIPPLVEKVVLKALEKDPQKRFANVPAFAKALEQAFAQSQPATTVPAGSTPAPPTQILPKTPQLATTILAGTSPTVLVKQPAGTCLYTYSGHTNFVQALAWIPHQSIPRLASGSDDRQVQIWDALTGQNVFVYRAHQAQVWTVVCSPDGKLIASGTARQVAHIWNVTNGNTLFTYAKHTPAPLSLRFALAWSPDGKSLVSGGTDTTVQVWDATNGSTLLTYQGHTAEVTSVAWSPDSKRIASASTDKTVQVWDATTGATLFTHSGHTKEVSAITWSPDGKSLASGSRDTTVQVWNAANDDRICTYSGHERRVRTLAWSPDSQLIASVDDEKVIQIWEVATSKRLFSCEGHSGGVNALAWSPDGQLLASASNDRSVRVWQVAK